MMNQIGGRMSDDLISRQDAAKAICEDGTALERQGRYCLTMAERKQRDADILEALPSAQPERQEMTELENKQTICDLLLRTLACTRALEDLDKITYDDKTENVTVRFRGGGQRMINVTADSGVAMIRDILRNIGV